MIYTEFKVSSDSINMKIFSNKPNSLSKQIQDENKKYAASKTTIYGMSKRSLINSFSYLGPPTIVLPEYSITEEKEVVTLSPGTCIHQHQLQLQRPVPSYRDQSCPHLKHQWHKIVLVSKSY